MQSRFWFFRRTILIPLIAAAFVTSNTILHAGPATKTRNVILITTDGLRWQEVFNGADPDLINKENGGVADTNALKRKFWRETPEERRAAMMPFLWNVVAKRGQIFGNKTKGSVATVTNGKKFSYPGYNEILCGFPSPDVTSNDKIPNQNVTVLEWLHRQAEFRGRVAAFSGWDVTSFIINRDRAGFPVFSGTEKLPGKHPSATEKLLNDLIADTTPSFDDEIYDSFLFQASSEFFRREKPRVFFVSYMETDDWAHAGRYDRVLSAARQVDDYVRRLWEAVQSDRQRRDKTTLIVTVDHGRGSGKTGWRHHGKDVDGAENIWLAAIGPDTLPLGERTNCPAITQSQVAATVAAFLGKDYPAAVPKAAPPIRDLLPKSPRPAQ